MMAIVIDTNIIVSALLNPSGSSYVFLDRVLAGEYQVVITEKIWKEYNEVLRRDKFHIPENVVMTILEWFRSNATYIEVDEERYSGEVIDQKDVPFYAAAKCTKSRLVTGNVKHYPVEEIITMLWEIK